MYANRGTHVGKHAKIDSVFRKSGGELLGEQTSFLETISVPDQYAYPFPTRIDSIAPSNEAREAGSEFHGAEQSAPGANTTVRPSSQNDIEPQKSCDVSDDRGDSSTANGEIDTSE